MRSALAQPEELERFEAARNAYERGDYPSAAERFAALVDGPGPRLQSRPLVLESRKYLAASYLFLRRDAEAEQQFMTLLREDGDYRLDPVAFPAAVVAAFEKARQQVELSRQKSEQQRQAEQRSTRTQQQTLAAPPATTSVERLHSRWVAAVPFGVGQFQNGHARLGTALAISEALFAALSVTSFALHASLRDEMPLEQDIERASRTEKAFRYSNWITTALFAATAIGGIIDAQLRFVPSTPAPRPVKLTAAAKAPQLRWAISPFGVCLHGRFD